MTSVNTSVRKIKIEMQTDIKCPGCSFEHTQVDTITTDNKHLQYTHFCPKCNELYTLVYEGNFNIDIIPSVKMKE